MADAVGVTALRTALGPAVIRHSLLVAAVAGMSGRRYTVLAG
jgi:hypothetical protein